MGWFGGRRSKEPAAPAVDPKRSARTAEARPQSGKPQAKPAVGQPSPQRPQQTAQRPLNGATVQQRRPPPATGHSNPAPAVRPEASAAARPTGAVGNRRPGANTGIEADPEALSRLMDYSGVVITAPNERIPTTIKQREVIAVLENGWVVVARSQASSIEAFEVRELLARNNVQIDQIWLVDLDVVRRLYENYTARTAETGVRSDPNKAQRQKDFIELVRLAARQDASDIHITVGRHEATVEIRRNGVMTKLRDMNANTANEMLQAAFAMADASDATYRPYDAQGARISERGASQVALPPGVQAIRLQYNPIGNGGRYLVARLLHSQIEYGREEDVDNLGYSAEQLTEIKMLRRKPTGINIISGPTGSGKSTTLQRSLMALMREKRYEVNVVTIEDPPEYVIKGAKQLPVVNAKGAEDRSEAFREAITAALRSDPDIIMIGEIRDRASADLAFQAAMTGHQVWCSLHANDAASCLDRLRDMQVDSYKLTDSSLITGLIGQRLVRKLNPKCRIGLDEAIHRDRTAEVKMLGPNTRQEAERLRRLTGIEVYFPDYDREDSEEIPTYLGRTVVAEIMRPDDDFMDFFRQEKKAAAIASWRKKTDGLTMVEHGIVKILLGEATPFEIEDKVGMLDSVTDDRVKELARKYLKGEA